MECLKFMYALGNPNICMPFYGENEYFHQRRIKGPGNSPDRRRNRFNIFEPLSLRNPGYTEFHEVLGISPAVSWNYNRAFVSSRVTFDPIRNLSSIVRGGTMEKVLD